LIVCERTILLLTLTQKDKEDLEEISSELELADEDEKVPYVCLALFVQRNSTADTLLDTRSATRSIHYRFPRCRNASPLPSTKSTTK
jgi:hypothetical protein